MRALSSWLVLPVLLATAVAGILTALSLHVPLLPVLAFGGAFYAAAIFALERWLPYDPEWQEAHGDVRTDLAHLVVTGGIVESAPALGLTPPAAASIWPIGWPFAAQVIAALLATELLNYWAHRLLHGPLWRFHAVHHSAPRLYWINSWRVHPVEGLFYWAATVVPLLLLGAPEAPLLVVWAASTVLRMLQHSNVDVRLGPLNWLFSGPELHRWHHSRERTEADSNYGNALIVWDVLFGTRRLPARGRPRAVGLTGDAYPASYGAQLLAPFRAIR